MNSTDPSPGDGARAGPTPDGQFRPPAALMRLGLSQREAEVLTLTAEGWTDAEIAGILVVSRRTVEKHLEHVFGKLGVRNRTAAAAAATRALALPLAGGDWPAPTPLNPQPEAGQYLDLATRAGDGRPTGGVLETALALRSRIGWRLKPLAFLTLALVGFGIFASALSRPPTILYANNFADPGQVPPTMNRGTALSLLGSVYDLQLENGELVVQISQGGAGAFFTPPMVSVTDQSFGVEVEARAEGQLSRIAYGFHPAAANRGVRFNVEPDARRYHVFRLDGDERVDLGRGVISWINPGSAINHLRLEWRGSELKTSVNGRLTLTANDAALGVRPMRIGLGVWIQENRDVTPEDRLRVIFDNVRIYTLPS